MEKHDGIVKKATQAKVQMDEKEIVRLYFSTEKLTFGTSLQDETGKKCEYLHSTSN